MKVSAKYLAWQLPSKGNPSLDDFFLSLVDNDNARCSTLKLQATKKATAGTPNEICELFIKNWAKQRLKNENKVTIVNYLVISLYKIKNIKAFLEQNCKYTTPALIIKLFVFLVNIYSNFPKDILYC